MMQTESELYLGEVEKTAIGYEYVKWTKLSPIEVDLGG
jgi:hypothetical protein